MRKRRFPLQTLAAVAIVLILAMVLSVALGLDSDLDHLDVRVLSGPKDGNYHAIVDRVKRAAARREGLVANVATAGTVDNLRRLAAAADDCSVQFALAQDGVPPPDGSKLELIGRLEQAESVLLLGKNASRLRRLDQLAGMRIGVGAKNSGTEHLARAILESDDFAHLGLSLVNLGLADQVEALAAGTLDLGVFVLHDEAAILRTAIRDRGLELAAFEHLPALASRFEFVNVGRIAAGQFDPLGVRPPEDRTVLRVDTLVVSNGCASRSETMALMSVLADQLPGFMDRNRSGAGSAVFARDEVARQFYEGGGPSWPDVYVPWLVDIMAPSNWVYIAMSISVLFNLLSGWHRLRAWRVDANRDRYVQIVRDVLGERLTPDEIAVLEPTEETASKDAIAKLEGALADLDALRVKCRIQENSFLVPMGHEGIYRYQEEQMEQVLSAVRRFVARAKTAGATQST